MFTNKYEPTEDGNHGHWLYEFQNGYAALICRRSEGFDLIITDKLGMNRKTPIQSDVLGIKLEQEIEGLLDKVATLPTATRGLPANYAVPAFLRSGDGTPFWELPDDVWVLTDFTCGKIQEPEPAKLIRPDEGIPFAAFFGDGGRARVVPVKACFEKKENAVKIAKFLFDSLSNSLKG